jgi:hypothetical protein
MTMRQWVELQLKTITEHGDGFMMEELVEKALQDFGADSEFREDMMRTGIETAISKIVDDLAETDLNLAFLPVPGYVKRRWNG